MVWWDGADCLKGLGGTGHAAIYHHPFCTGNDCPWAYARWPKEVPTEWSLCVSQETHTYIHVHTLHIHIIRYCLWTPHVSDQLSLFAVTSFQACRHLSRRPTDHVSEVCPWNSSWNEVPLSQGFYSSRPCSKERTHDREPHMQGKQNH